MFYYDWRKAKTWLIKQQEFWTTHQRPRNRQHLLLSPGHGHRALFTPLFQPREQIKHRLQIVRGMLVTHRNGPHQQIFFNGHIRENTSTFRSLRDTARRHVMRRLVTDILAAKQDLTFSNAWLTENGHQ
ncbi:hypothetical protein D3C87_1606840 [compost metagenome]